MNREKALKILLVVLGLFFVAAVYPIVMYLWRPGNEPPGDTMMLSLYFTLGIFLLLAAPNPSAHRSLIAYAGWANIVPRHLNKHYEEIETALIEKVARPS